MNERGNDSIDVLDIELNGNTNRSLSPVIVDIFGVNTFFNETMKCRQTTRTNLSK